MYTHKGRYLKSPLKLIGAKTKIRDRLYDRFPVLYNSYFEPFGGTFGVLIGKDKSEFESANDLNDSSINFFKCIQNEPEYLLDKIKKDLEIVQSDEFDFYKFRDSEPILGNSVQNASWFYIVSKLAMNGIYRRNQAGKCNSSYCKTKKGRGFLTDKWFWAVHERIKDVEFHNMDAIDYLWKVQSKKDSELSFIFLDPPYYSVKTTYNGKVFKKNNFEEIHDFLAHTNSKWMLTINDHPFIRDLFDGFYFFKHEVKYSAAQTAEGRKLAQELIVTNYAV